MQLNFPDEMFEQEFKPWLRRKLKNRAEDLLPELVEEFKKKLRECIATEVDEVMASVKADKTVLSISFNP